MEDFAQIVLVFIENTWNFFAYIPYPGLGISIGAFTISVFVIGLSLRILHYFFGFGGQSSAKSEKVKKINPKRRDDTK